MHTHYISRQAYVDAMYLVSCIRRRGALTLPEGLPLELSRRASADVWVRASVQELPTYRDVPFLRGYVQWPHQSTVSFTSHVDIGAVAEQNWNAL